MEKNNSKAITQVAGIFIAIIVIVSIFSYIANSVVPFERPNFDGERGFEKFNGRSSEFRETINLVQTIFASVNTILLLYLLFNYLSIYNHLKSRFALGLIVVAISFLAGSVAANPLLHVFFGFRGSGLGPFAIMPLIFTTVVVLVLIYLSRE